MATTLLNAHNPHAGPSSHNPLAMQRSVSDIPFADDEYEYGGGDPEAEADESIFKDMTFDEVLEDLNARFLVNLPAEERPLVRLYWQAEQAHWFYEDYLRPLNPHLPSLGQRHFTQLIIASSPLFSSLSGPNGIDYDGVWNDYISYKSMVPCCGAILLNEEADKCLVVRGWKSNAGWSFPRGKININEPEMTCAIREVEEETGFDLAGLINERDRIQTQVNSQSVTMYIVAGVDESTVFEAQTKNEIGAIEWVRNTELPTWTGKKPKKTGGTKEKKFYNVTPFVGPLKKWLQQHGYNPHPPSKKKQHPPQPSHLPKDNRRNLQPFFEEASPTIPSPAPAPRSSQHAHDQAASALDHLFDRFITKQEEDLRTGTAEAVTGTDQKEGMKRLFGNLDVLPSAEGNGAKAVASMADRQNAARKDDEDLVRLLGGMSAEPKPPSSSAKANRLLALLKSSAPRPDNGPSVPPHEVARTSDPAPMMKPHQASLLSMLSPNARVPTLSPGVTGMAGPDGPIDQSSISSHPGPDPSIAAQSIPVTPVEQSFSIDDGEMARRDKQRKLLEMAFAGMGLDTPFSSTQHPASSSDNKVADYAIPPIPSSHRTSPVKDPDDTGLQSSRSPEKPPLLYTGSRPTPPHSHTSTSSHQSPIKGLRPSGSSNTSPAHFTHRPNGSGGPTPPAQSNFGGHLPHRPSQAGSQAYQQQQPGMTSEQQRLLATLQARPHPAPPPPPAGQFVLGGQQGSRQLPGPGGMPPSGSGAGQGRGGGGYQMGIPGQPGQIPLPSNLTINQFPSLPPNQYHPPSHLIQPGGPGGGMPPFPQGGQHPVNLHAHRPMYPQQPPPNPQIHQNNQSHQHQLQQPYPTAQPNTRVPPGAPPNFGLAPIPLGQPTYPSHPVYHTSMQQGQGQMPGTSQYGGLPSSVRAQQPQHPNVLQPVPVPRQAAMGLLAMINGRADVRR